MTESKQKDNKALTALATIWDLIEQVSEQGISFDRMLAYKHDALLTEIWQVLLGIEDEIWPYRDKANSADEPGEDA